MRLPRRVRQRRRIRTRQAAAAVIVLCALGGASFAAYAHGSGAGVSAQHREMSAAWYVADSCKWTRADVRNCHTVLRFLAAFDLGRVEAACKQLSGLYLAQLTGGGLEGCKLFLRRDGSNRRIEYSISFSRLRPDGGEVLYTINPQGHRNLEQRYVATTVLEHGVSKIDSMTPIADPTRFLRSPLRDTGLRRHRLRNAFLARATHCVRFARAHARVPRCERKLHRNKTLALARCDAGDGDSATLTADEADLPVKFGTAAARTGRTSGGRYLLPVKQEVKAVARPLD